MATFLARSSRLCRLGSSWLATALICLQGLCTMALGVGVGRGAGAGSWESPVPTFPPPPNPAWARRLEVPLSVGGHHLRVGFQSLCSRWVPRLGWASGEGGAGTALSP